MAGYSDLSNMQKDVLKEIGNIGAGNAATAFAQFLDCRINMTVPSVEILPIYEVPEVTGGVEQIVYGVLLEVLGEAPGKILLLWPDYSIEHLMSMVLDKEQVNLEELNEIQISAIKEIGNILSGSYLSAINQLTNLNLMQTVPGFAHDMAGAILSTSLVTLSEESDLALLIETKFVSGDHEIEGYFFLIPDPGSLDRIFSSLGFELL